MRARTTGDVHLIRSGSCCWLGCLSNRESVRASGEMECVGKKGRSDSPYGKLISPDVLHVIVIALFHYFDKYVDGSHTSPVCCL